MHGSAAAAQEVSGDAVRPRRDGARTALPEPGRTPTAGSRHPASRARPEKRRRRFAGRRAGNAGGRERAPMKKPAGFSGFRLLTNPRQVGDFCFLMA
ncbi:hypothetical protein EGT61_031300 [Burkholderia mallei]|nr:hypothetical protein EGT61_031300 [Burkholderia mallei]